VGSLPGDLLHGTSFALRALAQSVGFVLGQAQRHGHCPGAGITFDVA
jgi:hypothetical protein